MVSVPAWAVAVLQAAHHELLLVAAVGILLLGTEDLLFDGLWLVRPRPSRSLQTGETLAGPIAIFVPAWDEETILSATLRHMLVQWAGEDIRIYVGCYPNDIATLAVVRALAAAEPRIRLTVAPHYGPTSKGDNLNQMWRALAEDERASATRFAAVVLHDAEDRVCAGEIALFRHHLPGAMMVQIPVEPLLSRQTGPIAAHYADEFAEAHAKEMPLRAALAAALPAAGVGCAFSRAALTVLALGRSDGPFQADSLTEDYEAGLVLGASGGICRFVDQRDEAGIRIATRSAFPPGLHAAVRQKGRWIAGIALGAWDRLDWTGGAKDRARRATHLGAGQRLLTGWMLWRDRRTALSAIIMLCAYASLVCAAIVVVGQWGGLWSARPLSSTMLTLLAVNALLLVWRLAMRALFTGSIYGWRQGLLAIPRAFVSNFIHIFAAYRALTLYARQVRSGRVIWDKTDHNDTVVGEVVTTEQQA